MRAHEEASFARRAALVQRRTGHTSLTLQSEVGVRLDEASARCRQLEEAYRLQKEAAEG